MRHRPDNLWILPVLVLALFMVACASMGRPEGGPRDEDPPIFVRSNPLPGQLNVDRNKIYIEFNENVQVKDVLDKVVVSPVQKTMPKIQAVGRRITVELADTLVPDATYTIDFTDAISDLNESNPLDGFAFDFATGSSIDSLCIAGMVLAAENLEPAQGMLVGVHSNLADSAITTLPFDRITRTNQYGQFVIRNLKAGSYRIFAIDDKNRDNRWDRSEDIAFFDSIITPSARIVQTTDTLKAADGTDSIVDRRITEFAPTDVLLTWFNEGYLPLYMAKYARSERNRIYFEMGAPSDSLPQLTIVGGGDRFNGRDFADFTVLNASPTLDTLEYWITDSALIALDSLTLATRYLRVDTADNISWTTDTLNFFMKVDKKAQKEQEEKKKKLDEARKKAEENGEQFQEPQPEIDFLSIRPGGTPTFDVFSGLSFTFDAPVKSIDPNAVHLEILDDTIWTELEPPRFSPPDSLRPMFYTAQYVWEPGHKYRLTLDSLGVHDIYGRFNAPLLQEFSVRPLEDYANLTLNISNLHGNGMAQLLDGQDKVVRSVPVDGGKAIFRHVLPGTYYARLFIDRDSSGKYTVGSIANSIQPEETFYYPKKFALKKNWDVAQFWDLFETPVDMQKPLEIKKNKPKLQGARKNPGEDDDEEDDMQYYDEFGNPAVDPDDPFGKRKSRRYNNLDSRDNSYSGQGAGYRRANQF